MLSAPRSLRVFAAALTVFCTTLVLAQDYPVKPIRIITTGAGGGSDFASRQIAQGISGPLGQPVIVDNRANALVGEAGSKAPPDGYTLTLTGASLWLTPLLQQVPYDIGDFAPLSLVSREVFILVSHPSLPVRNVKELIALAKARPAQINYGSSTAGGSPYLGMELLKSMTGIDIVAVPYKGTAPALNGVLGGEVSLTIADVALVMPHAKSGRLRPLGVTSADPSALAPGLPTVAAAGLPGYELIGATGMWVPAKTPATVTNRLSQEVVRFLNRSEIRERFLNVQSEIVASSPEQFGGTVRAETAKWSKLFKETGIKKL